MDPIDQLLQVNKQNLQVTKATHAELIICLNQRNQL